MQNKPLNHEKIMALAEFLECSVPITSPHHPYIFEVWDREYLVVTEQEAAELVAERIKEELWAFHPDWIIRHTLLRDATKFASSDYETIRQAFTAIQQYLMETCNPMLRGLIEATCGMKFFIEEAIAHNGRGHFLAPCDEKEEKQGDFYIYRMN